MNVPALKYALPPLVVWAGVSFVLWDCNPVRWAHACGGDERRCAVACPVEEQDIDYEPQPCECMTHTEVEG